MALTFGDVFAFWQGLTIAFGEDTMNDKATFGHECLREVLMRFRCCPAVSAEHMDDCLEMIRLLTVFASITSSHSMRMEVSEETHWIPEKTRVCGALESWQHLRCVIQRNPLHFNGVFAIARSEIKDLRGASAGATQFVVDLLWRVDAILNLIQDSLISCAEKTVEV